MARPAVIIPQHTVNPAQGRQQIQLSLAEVAAAEKRCVDKVEEVEEIVYEDVEECHHSYDKQCHTTYQTEFESQQEEECEDNFQKTCEVTSSSALSPLTPCSPSQITYSPQATNVTVPVCMTPLVKVSDVSARLLS